MTNLMKFIVFALLVASVCAVPLSRPASESEALISETEPKADELRSEPLRSSPSELRERAEAHEADDDKTEAQELKSDEKSRERAEELKSDEKSEGEAEELKSDEESKERAEELKSEEKERERRESEEREKAEELKSAERAEELKADEIKAEELKAEEKAESLKAQEFETKAKAEEIKAEVKAEELKSEEKEKEKERERRQSEQREKAEELKSDEKAEMLRAEELKAEEKAEMLRAEETKAEEKAEHLKAKEEAQEIKVEERAEELKSEEKEKEKERERRESEKSEGEAQELKSDEKSEGEAEELKSDEKTEGEAQEIKSDEKSEGEAQELRSKEKSEGEAQEIKSDEKSEGEAQEIKSDEKSEGEAQEIKSDEKSEGEAQEIKSDEKSEGEAQEIKSDEKSEGEAQELRSKEKSESEAQEIKSDEKERERREAEEREKAEGEAQELKSDEKSEGEAEELKSDEKTEGEAEELKSDEKSEGESQELKSDDKTEGEAQELKSNEEREKERMRRAIEKAIEAEALEADKERAEALKSDEPRSESLKKEERLAAERMMAMMSEQPPAMAEALVGQDPSAMIGGGPVASNPCDVPEFKYYQPHPTEPTKYYQCDPWGTFVEKKCGEGLHWDRWQLRCQEKEKIVNMTSLLPTTIRRLSDFNCTIAKFACKNGGECISNGQEFRCVCSGNFTGDMCEHRITDFDLYSEIMNGNFSIEDYIRRIMKENVSLDLSYYEQYKEVLEPAVYERLIRYLSHYKNGLVRYDTLVNSLVEDVLGDIYPDADFLRTFNISQQSVITTIRLVPNLLSYARYSSERYQEVFVQYQRVLEQLWSFLNTTVPRLRTEAVRYTELTQFFLNGTIGEANWKVLNETVSRRFGGRNFLNDTIRGDTMVRDAIKVDFESIMERARVLCEKLVKFEKHVVAEWKKNPEFVYKTVAQTGLTGADEFIGIFDEIKEINMDIWGTLVSYGFWFITNVFTTGPRVVA